MSSHKIDQDIPYACHDVSELDIKAVLQVLRSDFITQGTTVPRFEAAIAERVHVKYAIAANSATSALHLACLGLGLTEGDVLWTVPNTFVASANCGRYCGANVDFVDIDPSDLNISVPHLEEKLIAARRTKTLPKIIIPVHFSGRATQQEHIWQLSQEFGFKILEDAAHALGATHHGEPVGSCRWSHAAVFSFHAIKLITTGEGGMVVTNDSECANRMSLLRNHGITRSSQQFLYPAHGDWYYEQQILGFNYRMTDIQAALGLSQLSRLDDFLMRRRHLAQRYYALLDGLPLNLPVFDNQSAWHLYVVRLWDKAKRKPLYEMLRTSGIIPNVHYIPVHVQPYYQQEGFKWGDFPHAENYYNETLTLPLFSKLTDDMQNEVAAKVRIFFEGENNGF